MAKISKENKLCYIMGDFNLDLFNCHSHLFVTEFLDIMYSNMFFPLITRLTRVTSNTATLIDIIFTNRLDNYSFSGLLFTDISDHLPIFCFTISNFRLTKSRIVFRVDTPPTSAYINDDKICCFFACALYLMIIVFR